MKLKYAKYTRSTVQTSYCWIIQWCEELDVWYRHWNSCVRTYVCMYVCTYVRTYV